MFCCLCLEPGELHGCRLPAAAISSNSNTPLPLQAALSAQLAEEAAAAAAAAEAAAAESGALRSKVAELEAGLYNTGYALHMAQVG